MIVELWVWYDDLVGGMPHEFKVMEVCTMFDAAFVNFYGWMEAHGVSGPWHQFKNPDCVRGFMVRPMFPNNWILCQAKELLKHPGVEVVETVGTDPLDNWERGTRKRGFRNDGLTIY